jgi:hypothetical protein
MNGTPVTILVGMGGTVKRVWFGAFSKDKAREIEETFDIKLPGLGPVEQTLGQASGVWQRRLH